MLFGKGTGEIKPQLKPLAQKANGIHGYMIQEKGYASAPASAGLNQRLSAQGPGS